MVCPKARFEVCVARAYQQTRCLGKRVSSVPPATRLASRRESGKIRRARPGADGTDGCRYFSIFEGFRMARASHLVRVGLFGHVGRFSSASGEIVRRGHRVVCRTRRGLEIGVVLGDSGSEAPAGDPDGLLLRRVTPEDDLLLARLERDRERAFAQCTELLSQRGMAVTLVDVEHLFDGRSLFFYFLGNVTPEVDALTHELAQTYEATVQFRQFADALERGCGPDCGTESASGCGTGCASCAVASAC